ncbi:MAG TPA: hypothetical protein VJJ83_00260 [Candidatus Babeliales bacterium]|nr:hypothetical protein [Candidatus Babeliales bacterium]
MKKLVLLSAMALVSQSALGAATDDINLRFLKATDSENVDQVRSLLDQGANIDYQVVEGDGMKLFMEPGTTALILAVNRQNKELVKLLLERGASVLLRRMTSRLREPATAFELAMWYYDYAVADGAGEDRQRIAASIAYMIANAGAQAYKRIADYIVSKVPVVK